MGNQRYLKSILIYYSLSLIHILLYQSIKKNWYNKFYYFICISLENFKIYLFIKKVLYLLRILTINVNW